MKLFNSPKPMLEQVYDTLRAQLLAIDGMTSQPYQAKSGSAPKGGIEEFELQGKHFAGLRRTDKYIMLYVGPVLSLADLDARYSKQMAPIRSGKGCLKITKPEQVDLVPVLSLLKEGAASWQ